MRLHYTRVRCARGLAMPLPPTPRKRPLRPPVLFNIDHREIRTRADVLEEYGTWEAFLDRVAEVGLTALEDFRAFGEPHLFFLSVVLLVPQHERLALRSEIDGRMQALMDAQHDACRRRHEASRAEDEAWRSARARQRGERLPSTSLCQRFFRKAA